MLLLLAAMIAFPGQRTHVAASLRRAAEGGWEIHLESKSGGAWLVDPHVLQPSLQLVGANPDQRATVQFADAETIIQARTQADGSSSVSLPVTIGAAGEPCFARLAISGSILKSIDGAREAMPVEVSKEFVYFSPSVDVTPIGIGSRFLVLPGLHTPFVDSQGQTVPFSSSALREARLEEIKKDGDQFEARFRLEGFSEPVTLKGTAELGSVPGLAPVVWELAVKRLRTKFMGKPAWIYGGYGNSLGESPAEQATFRQGIKDAVKIRKILRVFRPRSSLALGPQVAGLGGDRPRSTFETDYPIYVVFNGPVEQGKNRIAVETVADEWHLERKFSPLSARDQHPDWSPGALGDIDRLSVRRGMTHAMVAWALGWPCEPGTKREMMKWQLWRYDIAGSHSYLVRFSDGRVVSYGADGGTDSPDRT